MEISGYIPPEIISVICQYWPSPSFARISQTWNRIYRSTGGTSRDMFILANECGFATPMKMRKRFKGIYDQLPGIIPADFHHGAHRWMYTDERIPTVYYFGSDGYIIDGSECSKYLASQKRIRIFVHLIGGRSSWEFLGEIKNKSFAALFRHELDRFYFKKMRAEARLVAISDLSLDVGQLVLLTGGDINRAITDPGSALFWFYKAIEFNQPVMLRSCIEACRKFGVRPNRTQTRAILYMASCEVAKLAIDFVGNIRIRHKMGYYWMNQAIWK